MKKNKIGLLGFTAVSLLLVLVFSHSSRSFASPSTDVAVYLPSMSSGIDVSISLIEVSQAIQTDTNSVPLVANRPTLVRVMAKTEVGAEPANISVTLSGSRGGSSLGTLNLGTATIPASPSRSVYDSTFNVQLPSDWLTGQVILTAKVDANGVLFDSNQANNVRTQTAVFNTVPDLNIVVVPIDYTHQGSFAPGFYPGNRVDYISDWIMRTFPVANVNVVIRNSNYPFEGNLQQSGSWLDLLSEMRTLKGTETGTQYGPTVYYGFVPIKNGGDQWFFSGIAGIGYVGGFRASVGLNLGNGSSTGELAAHEVGHNLGRSHAPCGGASGTDPGYPYSGASIGQYGLDRIDSSPQLLAPTDYVDVMSYCDPVWISDYTYTGLYNDQMNRGFMVQAMADRQMMMVINGRFDDQGNATFNPVYSFSSAPYMPESNSTYQIELFDTNGQSLGTYPVLETFAEEIGISTHVFSAVVPVPSQPVGTVKLVQGDTAVAQRALASPPANLAVVSQLQQASNHVDLSWGLPDVPALVRYTADEGQSWTVVGTAVLGGQLRVDTTTLPGGENGRFEIILADRSQPIVLQKSLPAPLPNQTPLAWMSGETRITAGDPVYLTGHGSDAEDGALQNVRWVINGELVSQDRHLLLADLPIGEHMVTMIVEDSAGETATVGNVITVTP